MAEPNEDDRIFGLICWADLTGCHLAQNLAKSRSREIVCYIGGITLTFDRHLGSAATEVHVCQISERLEKSKHESRGFET